MSDFLKKLEARHKKTSATESMTIRVTAEEDAAIKELANFYECTRQDLIHDLITEYLVPAYKQLVSESASTDVAPPQGGADTQHYYALNTNKVNDVADHDFMLREGVAAAFEDGYKEKINRLKKGDTIFLYESGKGIVAYGQAAGVVQKAPHHGKPDKTFFQKLEGFKKLEKPLSPRDICRVLGRNIKLAQTLTYLTDGETLLTELEQQ